MSLDLFNLSHERLRKILATALAGGGSFADVYAESSRLNSLTMEEGILKTASSSLERGVGVRVVKGEKTGYAYTETLDEPHFLKIARVAASIANSGGGSEPLPLCDVNPPNYALLQDPATGAPLDRKIHWINFANEYAYSLSSKITKVSVSFVDNWVDLVMADTRGRFCTDSRPMLRFSITVIAEHDGEKEMGRAGDGGRKGLGYITEDLIRRYVQLAVNEALVLLEAKQAPSGTLPVILGPGDSGILLHEAIGHPLEADFNRKGSSAYSGRMGELVASSQCTIVDDGTIEGDRGSLNIDDELNPSQRTVLIEQGRLTSYMHDEISAQFYGVESTGNGRRESYRYQPLPRMRTTYMLPGSYDPGELIASTDKGIFCETFRGGQVDISNGNFVFVPSRAFLIEDGKITVPIKNLSLIGNGPDVLTNVTMVANDFKMGSGSWTCGKGQSVPVGVGMPTVKISGMTVGGRQ